MPSPAAPAFAATMLRHEVRGTISVGRRILLIAEVPIQAGSPLDGLAGDAVNAERTPSRCLWPQI